MIDSKIAALQIERMAGLDFFPKDKPALKELRLALEVALSPAIAQAVVDDWLSMQTAAPKPAELRRLTYDKQAGMIEQQRKCNFCGGSGFITIWKLVTYRGNSFAIERAETLPDPTNYEAAMNFARDLAEKQLVNPKLPRQVVLSVAKDCSCRKVAVSA